MDAGILFGRVRDELTSLAGNRFVAAAEAGPVPEEALRRIAWEEDRIVRSDRRSFALLAARFPEEPAAGAFLGLAEGEGRALALLGRYAAAVGADRGAREDCAREDGEPTAAGQGYAHHLGWLAAFGTRSAVGLALLVNFGFWGDACARLARALRVHHGLDEDALAFFTFFARSPPGFDDAALALIARGLEAGEDPREAARAARLMQAYETAFWDALPT